jgi:hypothetical protein
MGVVLVKDECAQRGQNPLVKQYDISTCTLYMYHTRLQKHT